MANDSTSPLFCEHCLANNELKLELQSRGVAIENCGVCGKSNGRALPADDEMARKVFRALVRLNFSEPEYNTHLGGDPLQSVVFGSDAIFALTNTADEMEFEQVFLTLEEPGWYPQEKEAISLGGGYWEGRFLWGLREQRDGQVTRLLKQSLERNYFDVEPDARALVRSLHPYIPKILDAGETFFRGRLGAKERLQRRIPLALRQTPLFAYVPYAGDEIGAPPVVKASAGRLNRAHVSHLYLATDSATAIAELRPHPGELVSIAGFRLGRSITVANLADHDIREYLSDEGLEVLRTILSVGDVLNVPVQPENRHLYAATQLLSDAFRLEGYAGVLFRSSVGRGTNLVCFEQDAFEQVPEISQVWQVASLSYEVAQLDAQKADYNKVHFETASSDPLSTLVHGMLLHSAKRQ